MKNRQRASERTSDVVRRAISGDLIIWTNAQDWRRKVELLLARYLGTSVKQRLRRMDPDRFYSDDLTWLEQALDGDHRGLRLEDVLADKLIGWRVRTYHACRPRDVLAYYRLGVRYLRPEETIEEIRRLVERHEQLSHLRDPRTLAKAVEGFGTDLREGFVFVGLDDRDLLDGGGHYLIYGSEYLSSVLSGYREELKSEGIPTVFIIHLPISLMRQSDLHEFARLLLSQWAKNVVTRRKAAPAVDFTFTIPCDVPAECIFNHYHPHHIRDPLNSFEVYVSPAIQCRVCRKTRPRKHGLDL